MREVFFMKPGTKKMEKKTTPHQKKIIPAKSA